jgi:hypothetical protein
MEVAKRKRKSGKRKNQRNQSEFSLGFFEPSRTKKEAKVGKAFKVL